MSIYVSKSPNSERRREFHRSQSRQQCLGGLSLINALGHFLLKLIIMLMARTWRLQNADFMQWTDVMLFKPRRYGSYLQFPTSDASNLFNNQIESPALRMIKD